jgi:hypothetical protein
MSRGRAAASSSQDGLRKAITIYLTASAFAHLTWEALQLLLYTIWNTGTIREKAFALAHCTAGDLLIAISCLVVALILAGSRDWPNEKFLRVACVAIVLGVFYTAFSEWLNVTVRAAWGYSDLMPVIRVGTFAIGLSPLLQWIIVPTLAFLCVRKAVVRHSDLRRLSS